MELTTYLQILNRRKWIIILTTINTMVAFYFIKPLIPTTYKATTILRILPYTSTDPQYTQLVYAERIMNTYVRIASSSTYLEDLKGRLGLESDKLLSVEAQVIPDSELIQIIVEDQDPVLALAVADTMAEILLEERSIRDVRIQIIEPAGLPEPPSLIVAALWDALALVLGIMIGIALAFISENLDTRLHTTEQIIEVTGLPILGEIPQARKRRKNPYFLHDPDFYHGIRSMRTLLLSGKIDEPFKTILIASAYPKEGKSTLIASLAVSLALINRKVLIVDADMHYPNIHKIFNLNNKIGLSNLLAEPVDTTYTIQKTTLKGVSVLTSGPESHKSTELLGSRRMGFLLKHLSVRFDYILIDTPAFHGLPDAAMIIPSVDAVILLAKRGLVRESTLQATLQQLEQMGIQPLGIVVNNAKKVVPSRYRRYYRQIKNFDPFEKIYIKSKDFVSPYAPKDKVEPDVSANRIPEENDKSDLSDSQDDIGLTETDIDAEKIKLQTSQDKDNLTEIHGIGPKVEKALNSIGITTFEHLAEQDSDDLEKRIEGMITTQRTKLDQWIEKARVMKTADDAQLSDHRKNTNDGLLE